MNIELLRLQIALTLLPEIGSIRAKSLISYCGSVESIFKEKRNNLLKIPGIGEKSVKEINNFKNVALERAEKEIEFIEKYKISPLFFLDKNYPQRLKNCSDAPLLLYYKGNADLNCNKIISIVGTRNATEYGKGVCESIITELVKYNVLVVSGLAYGIDVCSHKASLKNGLNTVAVLGTGLNNIYPPLHVSIAKKIVEQGGLLTEFISNTKPDRENFPQRNRIIAGLSDAVMVIEAGETGGALITADIANSYNRDVFAIPGRINDPFSVGCNNLIRDHKAHLVQSPIDIELLLGWEQKKSSPKIQKELFIELSSEEKMIIRVLKESDKISIDNLCIKTQLSMSQTSSVMLNLEMAGLVKALPGKIYQLS